MQLCVIGFEMNFLVQHRLHSKPDPLWDKTEHKKKDTRK